jgi:hypothetical protein
MLCKIIMQCYATLCKIMQCYANVYAMLCKRLCNVMQHYAMLCKIMQYYATPKLHQVQIKWRGAAPHQRFPLLVRCAGCDDATETSSTSKARARPTGCDEDLLDGIPYVNSMSVTAHLKEHEHTEKPTGTGLATRPSRRRGGPAACQSVSDTQQKHAMSLNTYHA